MHQVLFAPPSFRGDPVWSSDSRGISSFVTYALDLFVNVLQLQIKQFVPDNLLFNGLAVHRISPKGPLHVQTLQTRGSLGKPFMYGGSVVRGPPPGSDS